LIIFKIKEDYSVVTIHYLTNILLTATVDVYNCRYRLKHDGRVYDDSEACSGQTSKI
jgi:hypothetical protein